MGRIVPLTAVCGLGLILVGVGVLSDEGTSGGERLAAAVGGVLLLVISVRWLPHLRRYFGD